MDEKDYQEKLESERFRGVYSKIDANYTIVNDKLDHIHELTMEKLEKILDQTTKTNGRVTLLEKETRFSRTITKYPKLSMLAVIGIIALTQIENIIKVINKLF
jgi:hypothetical protein